MFLINWAQYSVLSCYTGKESLHIMPIFKNCIYLFIFVYKCFYIGTPCGVEKMTCRSWLTLSTVWIPVSQLQIQSICFDGKRHYLMSYLTVIIVQFLLHFLFIVLGGMHATAYTWWSEDNLRWLILSFQHMNNRDWTQAIRFGGKHLYLCYLAYPLCSSLLIAVCLFPIACKGDQLSLSWCFCLFFKIKEFKMLCVWMFCLYVCMCTLCEPGAHRSQKWASDRLELEYKYLWAAIWVLRIEPRYFVRTTNALNHWHKIFSVELRKNYFSTS